MYRVFGLQWHVTNNCDQRCKHCYIWQKYHVENIKIEPTFEQCQLVVKKFVNFCQKMNVKSYLSITGSDPLLYRNIWKLLEFIHSKQIPFTILGNPYHLTEKMAKRLKHLGCISYQVSLDGMEEIHDSVRMPGSYRATLDAIPILNQAGIKSMIMTTVSLLNYKDIPAVAELCTEYKVKNFAFARYCPTHGDIEYNMPPILYRQFLSDMWQVYQKLIDKGTNFSLKDHLWTAFLYEEGLYKLSEQNGIVMDGCNCAVRHMTLLPNGVVYACRRFESEVGKIYQQSFEDIFLSPTMNSYRQVNQLVGCRDCDLLNYCRGCHAVSAGTTGNYFSKDPQCWRC